MAPIQETIGFALAQLCKAHRYSVGAALRDLELHVGQEMILLQLWAEEGMPQSQLAERLEVEPPTLSKMLHRMERDGLVERCPSADDARISRVSLTARGRALQQPVTERWASVEARLIAGLTTEERLLLRRLLLQLRTNLE